MSNDATPFFSSPIFRERVLEAINSELHEDAVRSAFAQNERFCLFSDSFEGNGKGVEMLLEFTESGALRALSAFRLNSRQMEKESFWETGKSTL